jgi:predicted DNA-binding transcriptional regulator AlpA
LDWLAPGHNRPEQIRHARGLLTWPDNTVSSIARLLGVSRAIIYKYVPNLTTPRPLRKRSAARQTLGCAN